MEKRERGGDINRKIKINIIFLNNQYLITFDGTVLYLKYMKATNIHQELHRFIDGLDDKKAKAIYTFFENEIDVNAQRKKLIEAERTKHLNGEGEILSWDTVKEMALD